jgi:hypothetical protein
MQFPSSAAGCREETRLQPRGRGEPSRIARGALLACSNLEQRSSIFEQAALELREISLERFLVTTGRVS